MAQLAVAQVTTVSDSALQLREGDIPFTINQLYYLVVKNHPVAKQAALLSENARQEIRLARGSFDPKLEASYLNKNFEGKEYYSILNAGVKFPTLFPINPTVGVENNTGQYLNPERYISETYDYTQFYTGVSIPLGRGLMTDDRRNALKQAQLFLELSEAEQVKMVNKLLFEVAKDYWEWYYTHYYYRITDLNVSIAQNIFDRVKANQQNGEVAVIDTVQASITLQQWSIERQEALLQVTNARIKASFHLWDSLGEPMEIPADYVPVLTPEEDLITVEELLERASQQHPELLKVRVKVRQAETDQALAREYLKPVVNLNYYLLNQPFDPDWNTSLTLTENYKWGVDFSLPLFLRKERSKYQQTKLKLSNVSYEQKLMERDILNQVRATYNQLRTTQGVLSQQREMVKSYERLLAAELMNLDNGESDLFKITIQQEKLLQARAKYLKLLSSTEKLKAELFWAAGTSPAY
jgi:outer membrane protein TolC